MSRSERNVPIHVSEFDQLPDGIVPMSAPSYKGVLQINVQNFDDKPELHFEKSNDTIVIARIDERPVQADILGFNPIYRLSGPVEPSPNVYKVFARPVGEVRFERTDEGWILGNPEAIALQALRLKTFAYKFGDYALEKLEKLRRQKERGDSPEHTYSSYV